MSFMIFVSGINERVVQEPEVLSRYKNFRFDEYNHCFNEQEKVAVSYFLWAT